MNPLNNDNLLVDFCRERLISEVEFIQNYHQCYQHLVNRIIQQAKSNTASHPLIIGLSAPQGAGKSTLVELIKFVIEQISNFKVATVSLDDFYLTKYQRMLLASNIHPLLTTRGVPGTHDIDLAFEILSALTSQTSHPTTKIPRFNKSKDDRFPEKQWTLVEHPTDIILLEGWCLNAIPQTEQALLIPINRLEQDFDSEGVWRHYVNQQLAGKYRELFDRLDLSVTLLPPSFEVVCDWRKQQEVKLRHSLAEANKPLTETMDDQAIDHFMMHFERLTRHHFMQNQPRLKNTRQLNPSDILIELDASRKPSFICE